jgi:hypothetical protein
MSDPIPPSPTPDSAGFWAATARGELTICACPGCDRYLHPPLERCPDCGGQTRFRAVSGAGTLHSYIVVHRAVAPGYGPGHVIGLVDLAEQAGLRLAATLVDLSPDSIRIGMALRARLVALPGSEQRIPAFGPASPPTNQNGSR